MENRNLEGIRQDLASRLVQREVVQCVSGLISGIQEISQKVSYKDMQSAFCTDSDELIDLFQRYDYEEAVRNFVMNEADLDDLEALADNHGYWSDVLSDANVPEGCEDVEEYVEAHPEALNTLRAGVWELINTEEEFRTVCDDYGLDPDVIEVYEHWIVTDWLQRRLAEQGEITGDIMNLSIWGRCCTGQSIALDHNIREIARELWPEEWDGKETT